MWNLEEKNYITSNNKFVLNIENEMHHKENNLMEEMIQMINTKKQFNIDQWSRNDDGQYFVGILKISWARLQKISK